MDAKHNKMNHFSLLAQKYFVENGKMLGLGTVAILCFWTIIGGWLGWFGYGGGAGALLFYSFIMMLVYTVVVSLMFRDMNGKQKRIATLMTPASIAEKFWIRFIVTVPLFCILIMLGYCMMEWSRMLFYMIGSNGTSHFFLPSLIMRQMSMEHQEYLLFTLIGSSVAFSLAVYMIGAICWPKYSFLKTMALEYGVQFVLTILWTIFVATAGVDFFMDIDITEGIVIASLWVLAIVFILLSVVGVWFSYYKFKTKTL